MLQLGSRPLHSTSIFAQPVLGKNWHFLVCQRLFAAEVETRRPAVRVLHAVHNAEQGVDNHALHDLSPGSEEEWEGEQQVHAQQDLDRIKRSCSNFAQVIAKYTRDWVCHIVAEEPVAEKPKQGVDEGNEDIARTIHAVKRFRLLHRMGDGEHDNLDVEQQRYRAKESSKSDRVCGAEAKVHITVVFGIREAVGNDSNQSSRNTEVSEGRSERQVTKGTEKHKADEQRGDQQRGVGLVAP
mmetsp:Transcript_19014/g.55296  ORF Transcript_19014/g.55296 Transcript_19014/m.55296 type:complete len:240 (-) Transcript_19014:743-1462(-)